VDITDRCAANAGSPAPSAGEEKTVWASGPAWTKRPELSPNTTRDFAGGNCTLVAAGCGLTHSARASLDGAVPAGVKILTVRGRPE